MRELERRDGWAALEALGAEFEAGVRSGLRRSGRDCVFLRMGSMFCLYFTSGPVRNLADAQRSDKKAFGRFFHGCLERGVYFAPSQFEAGFLSLAHTAEDISRTSDIVAEVLGKI